MCPPSKLFANKLIETKLFTTGSQPQDFAGASDKAAEETVVESGDESGQNGGGPGIDVDA